MIRHKILINLLLSRVNQASYFINKRCNSFDNTVATNKHEISVSQEISGKALEHSQYINNSSANNPEKLLNLDLKMNKMPPKASAEIAVVLSANNLVPQTVKVKELYVKIRHMHSDDILAMLEHSFKDLDRIHLAACIKRLYTVSLYLNSDYKERVSSHKGFQNLCALLGTKARFYNADISYDILIFLSEFGFNSNNPVIQVYLQLAKSHMNHFELLQIIKFSRCLMLMDQTHQTGLLIQGLKLLCPQKRPDDIGDLKASEIAWLLAVFGKNLTSEQLSRSVHSLLNEIHNLKSYEYLVLLRGLLAVKQRDLNPSEAELINDIEFIEDYCASKLCSVLPGFHFEAIFMVVDLCIKNDLYCPDIYKVAGELVLDKKISLNEQLKLFSLFWKQSYLHKDLCSSIISEVTTAKTLLKDINVTDVHQLLSLLAENHFAGNNTVNYNSCACQLAALIDTSYIADLSFEKYCDICLNIIHLLGAKKLFESTTALNPEVINKFKTKIPSKTSTNLKQKVVLLASLVRDYSDGYQRLISVINDFPVKDCVQESPLKAFLNLAFKNVTHGCMTKQGLLIDHLIILNSLQPIEAKSVYNLRDQKTIADTPVLLEPKDLSQLSSDVQNNCSLKKIAFVVLPNECFVQNTGQPKLFARLYVNQIKNEDFLPILIKKEKFIEMDEREIIPYLRHKVFNADQYQDFFLFGKDNL